MNRTLFYAALTRLSVIAFALAAAPSRAADASRAPGAIRWVLAHTRDDKDYSPLFSAFARRVEKNSGGKLKIEFIGAGSSDESRLDELAHDMVLDGAAEMGQFERNVAQYVPAVTAPFAFRSYAHAEAVFRSPVGKRLLDGLYASSDRKLRALAFTYSGGQRVLFGAAPVRSPADLKGQRMESPGNSGWSGLMDELMRKTGAELRPAAKDFDADSVDQLESAINRGPLAFEKSPGMARRLKYINRTDHGLLVTAVVANEGFLAGLGEVQRRILVEEVEKLALEERKLSISLEPRRLELLKKLGLEIVELPPAERRKWADLAEGILQAHPEIYREIREMRSVKE